MKTGAGLALGLVVALAAASGYYAGTRGAAMPASHNSDTGATAAGAEAPKPAKKLLYYRNPMGLPDTSPTPKKDPMGMDYIAVYEGSDADEAAAPGQVVISTQKVQKLGVRVEAAQKRILDKTVRAAGRIEPDERRLFTIAPKFEGYIERLLVSTTGQSVAKGQPLFEAYSPELVSAQREYAIAAQGVAALKDAGSQAQTGMQQLAQSSLLRLKNWDISDEQIKALTSTGATQRTLTFRSPATGIVMEKKAVQGMRFMPGEMLYQVADLSRVWVMADVFEQDLALVKNGAKAQVNINAYPDKTFTGVVTYVYPMLKAETRTVPVRVELANPSGLIKPGMFAQVELQVAVKAAGITVPVSAVIDSGTRQIVLVQLKEGRYEPRAVKTGARSDSYIEVLEGVQEGEQVVIAANFLIDAESNLKAAVGGFAGAPTATASSATAAVNAPAAAGHRAEGTVEEIDSKTGTVTLIHGPITSLKWPAMTMEFKTANVALFKTLKPGAKVAVEFVERAPGEWVITSAKPQAAQ
ncbi:MAG: efflux RND transporter periplasmic adaptor subunit [Rhodoferax sp.]|uniref:efflux RND transporter periplasmic adaptor subunit n=1 Tax=Rhodoferax sp. TaxID=50421 RepID=UPI00261C8C2D|nr:efflux RND transporter periplasmic adaptor subunit [Rhodoferax sp.]MDD2878949.1 efflux RND transporter periplasmic adaptor subunit [Rhodoferax sp.]